MPRHPSSQPTDVELKILGVLWREGPCTVRQVHEALAPERDRGYSTTLKMMQVMREKRLVVRDDSVRPQLEKLVMRMLDAERVSPDEVAEMQKLIQDSKGGGQ